MALVAGTVLGRVVGLVVGYGAIVVESFELTSVKLAHEIRVLLAKWMTKERLPKKAPMPGNVEAKSSVYVASKGSDAMLPYFPERSPVWQV